MTKKQGGNQMSEKRFTYTVDDRGFYTINDNVTG